MSTVLSLSPLGAPPWGTADPFLFCVHHKDAYPAGDGRFGPAASLAGREIGQDFSGKDGWRMYHGQAVPGFPSHPHRGFETVTITRRGYVDHADSLGARARYGQGDVQWLTAGAGIVHAEMFPLLETDRDNPLELFQIWLNLPSNDKMAEPHFSMFWADRVPRARLPDDEGRLAELVVVAGRFGEIEPPAPPPRSWASRPDSDVAIWTIHLDPGAALTLPPARSGSRRTLYLYEGGALGVDGQLVAGGQAAVLRPEVPAVLRAGAEACEILLLQGRPIGEPVVAYGPFVMNTRAQIQQAFDDYQRTRFGGWPWKDSGPVHGGDRDRFAVHPDGRVERAEDAA